MDEFIRLMAAPFAACILLVGIHAYLGLHVLARGVIFVDLALAQIAALGASVGMLFGAELHESSSYGFALGFALLGAGAFAAARPRGSEIPQEAVIGILYAVSSAAAILVMDRLPHGSEQIKSLLVGSILWVTWDKIGLTALLYGVVGAVHWALREPFWRVSRAEGGALGDGRTRLLDFAFYGLFAFVVTSSVQIAGVLLVFCFLIVPAVASAMFATSVRGRLAFGWGFGAVVSVIGCAASYVWNLPTGAAVVCVFGAILFGAALAKRAGLSPR